jgi:hypothetical protein
MPADQMNADDLKICDDSGDVRMSVSITGEYSLADRWDARGKLRKFPCRAVSISQTALTLAAPAIGAPGKRVVADLELLGRIEGFILRPLEGGFAMSMAMTEAQLRKLLEQIEWLEQQAKLELPDRRAYGRFVPIIPYSTLALADGTRRNCLIIDLSEAGAQIAADIEPAVGTVLAVGTLVGRVVRCFGKGFAVKFIDLQNADTVETKVLVNDCWKSMTLLSGR